MSFFFMLLFAVLTVEMVVLFLLVLPLPLRMRRTINSVYDELASQQRFKTVLWICAGLVGLLFVDSVKRANVPVSLYHHKKHGMAATAADENSVTPVQALVSRSYNQRNVYISGFILYFYFSIITVMSIIRRLVKYQTLKASKTQGITNNDGEDQEILELKQKLLQKDVSLKGLQIQIKNLESHFDSSNAPTTSEPSLDKKKQ